jgi:CRP-like cAMP-binding protein
LRIVAFGNKLDAEMEQNREASMADPALAQRADVIRAFNRQYTPLIGVLTDSYLDTPYPLAAVRIVYELGARHQAIAAELARDLGLDRGYLSRLVNRLRRDGLIEQNETGARWCSR